MRHGRMAREQAATFRIEALDRASKVLNNVERKLGSVGASAKRMGKSMTTSLTLPLALISAKALTTFADFELSMAKVKAVSGATGDKFRELEEDARRLGSATKFTASEVAGLQLNYSKLGFKPDEILKVTEATLALAQATDEDLAASAVVAGGTLRGFRLDASKTERVTDVMAKSFSSSALDLEKFNESMKYIAPVAAEAKISLEETTAMTSVLANNMIDGSMAGTAMRVIINKLGSSGKPLSKVLENLSKKNIGLAEAESLVGVRAQTALLILAKNTKEIKKLTKEYENAGGSAKEMAEIMDDTLSGAFNKLKSASEGALIAIGKIITPVIEPMLKDLTELFGKISKMNPELLKTGVTIAGIVAVVGPSILILGALVSSIGAIAGAFLKLKVIISGTTAALGLLRVAALANPLGAALVGAAALALVLPDLVDYMGKVFAKPENNPLSEVEQSAKEIERALSKAGVGGSDQMIADYYTEQKRHKVATIAIAKIEADLEKNRATYSANDIARKEKALAAHKANAAEIVKNFTESGGDKLAFSQLAVELTDLDKQIGKSQGYLKDLKKALSVTSGDKGNLNSLISEVNEEISKLKSEKIVIKVELEKFSEEGRAKLTKEAAKDKSFAASSLGDGFGQFISKEQAFNGASNRSVAPPKTNTAAEVAKVLGVAAQNQRVESGKVVSELDKFGRTVTGNVIKLGTGISRVTSNQETLAEQIDYLMKQKEL